MSHFIHGDNIEAKTRKKESEKNKSLLGEIRPKYEKWKKDMLEINGTSKKDIDEKVKLLNLYKDFIDQPKFKKEKGNTNGFTAQSKLHSTVLEEFMYYLFKDIKSLANKKLHWGNAEAYTNLYFAPGNISSFEKNSSIVINVKEQDFCISKEVVLKSCIAEGEDIQENRIHVPVVSIECKTYLDKTMYEGSVSTAEKIKKGNPYCIFLIVTETYEVKLDVDPKCSNIDQIYVLRKANGFTKNPIYVDVVWDLFKFVESHVGSNWHNVGEKIGKGKMI